MLEKIKEERKNAILNFIGIFFLALGIFSILYSFSARLYDNTVWLCYLSLILIGAGIMIRNSDLVVAQLNILTIPLIIWNIDFFYHLFADKPLWGITNYFFSATNTIIGKLISLQHIYVIPIIIFTLYIIKIRKKDVWKISFIEMILIFVIGKIFTSPSNNINCVFESCIPISFPIPYEMIWFIATFLMVFLTNYIITRIPFLKYKPKL